MAPPDLPVREKTLWWLLYDTAARADEALGLNVDDLDLDDKTATVVGKGGRPRQVNWYTHTAHLLPRLIDSRSNGPLFLAERRPLRPVASLDLDAHTDQPASPTGEQPRSSPPPPDGPSTSCATPASENSPDTAAPSRSCRRSPATSPCAPSPSTTQDRAPTPYGAGMTSPTPEPDTQTIGPLTQSVGS